ncbi:FAD-dependent oxidoreductase [Cucumibacter marinus]|uniref:FAD-dependent oxidoreductase n=1 Tax=Cucumibacter marinus TaxID=1121252 RepID=UPI000420CDAA|nr:FAD-dependent oxidoreductase [Cucumibacter marinus]
MGRYQYEPFETHTPPELSGGDVPARYKVAIVGAGPVGLAMAIDLALHGVPVVVLDDNNVVSVGSRAICWSKRTLEVFDRLGVGERMVDKGVTWKVGRLYHKGEELYSFDLLPEPGHKMPAFINLQQYYVEEYLVTRCRDFPDLIDLRFKNKVTGVENGPDGATLAIETPEGDYRLTADYVIACDGAKSPIRGMLGLDFLGRLFEEHFLIADVEMKSDTPSERWFWFEPDFHPGQSALLHKQPDDIYRIDLQLGWDADTEEEKKPENVIPRIEKAVGGRPFELDWVSIYTFQCRRLERFVHDRVIFVGDSAHIVSPFGARGGNGGIQDVDNLGWKLAAIIEGDAPQTLIETYNDERVHGADENIMNSSRSTNFMSPRSDTEMLFRNEVLRLAHTEPFARKLINSGRLSVPCSLEGFPLGTPSSDAVLPVGSPPLDAPLEGPAGSAWLLNVIGGDFTLVGFGDVALPEVEGVRTLTIRNVGEGGDYADADGLAFERYGEGLAYLFRPDQHVAAVFAEPDAETVKAARDRALGKA